MSMRIDLEVLFSIDLIITSSVMQSADESVSVSKQAMTVTETEAHRDLGSG